MTRGLVLEHLDAFNAHDTERLLATLHPDVVWTTGTDTFRGTQALGTDLFDDGLWAMDPSLVTRTLVVEQDTAAAVLTERLAVDGAARSFDIAVFFTVSDRRITSVRVFREGSADL